MWLHFLWARNNFPSSWARHEQRQVPGTWFCHVYREFFIYHSSLSWLELGDIFLQQVREEHQVISIEKLTRQASLELVWKYLHHQGEEQWAGGRALMHTNSHIKLFTVLTFDWSMTPCIGVHACMTRTAHSSTPRSPKAQTGPSFTHEDFLKVHKGNVYRLLAAKYFFRSRHTVTMLSVVPLPGTKLKYISAMFNHLTDESLTLIPVATGLDRWTCGRGLHFCPHRGLEWSSPSSPLGFHCCWKQPSLVALPAELLPHYQFRHVSYNAIWANGLVGRRSWRDLGELITWRLKFNIE